MVGMTDTTEALKRIDAQIRNAEIDLGDARRCESLHITPATGTIVRRLDATIAALREARALIPEPPTEDDREGLYADAINLAAERGLGPHPLPESYVIAARSGVDAALAAGFRREPVTVTPEMVDAALSGWHDDFDFMSGRLTTCVACAAFVAALTVHTNTDAAS